MKLRSDAQRNQERLVAAATEAFREQGLQVPLEEIAKRAGVSPGTLYNRFGGRDALIDAVMPALVESRVRDALTEASAIQDPWDAFARYVTLLCELQASDLALNDAVSRRFPDAAELTRICDAQMISSQELVDRAQRAGALRADFTAADLAYVFWSTSMILRATAGIAPEAWRRALGITLDGLRASAAHSLTVPPMTMDQVHTAMIGLGNRR
ncbi:TetR/AcrR family transcriptional regulator [Winogradskya consettensis]|uniref:TetR family transcriptional regulator n=1 Tax=Winogradskya consettensis TaxID=113560 RepID=A0A919T0D4_9ACTN|nr:TetR/AcrR family transcriptional regulator [Actinoplanes consettensis]GIM81682.1 TetR family transcriptional regulator [Actinoplanes consettensis]